MDADPDSAAPRSYVDAILWLWNSGLRFGSAIDLGCADGQFSVALAERGPLRESVLLNVDAQDVYRDSLVQIQAALGGHYRICAVGAQDGGTVNLQGAAHPYWASLRPAGDPYWQSINNLIGKPVTVPQRSLDALVAELALPAPHLLKMDIQGGELAALEGGREMLRGTAAIVLEIATGEFAGVHEALDGAGFGLFDLSDLHYAEAGVLGWFYATYLAEGHRNLRPRTFWSAEANEGAVFAQGERRKAVREWIAQSLARKRAGEWPELDGSA